MRKMEPDTEKVDIFKCAIFVHVLLRKSHSESLIVQENSPT